MYGARTVSVGEAELERLLRRVDRAAGEAAQFAGCGADSMPKPRTDGARAFDGEAMDFGSLGEAWRALPPDIKQYLITLARRFWDTRDANLYYLVALASTYIRAGMPPPRALRAAALRLRVPPRPANEPPGIGRTQVKQYHRRQEQRGRRPGRATRTRPGRQREAEALDEFGRWDEADHMSRQRGQGNVLEKCKELIGEDNYQYLRELAWQRANRQGHRQRRGCTQEKHQLTVAKRTDSMLRAACRLIVQGSGYEAAVRALTS